MQVRVTIVELAQPTAMRALEPAQIAQCADELQLFHHEGHEERPESHAA